MNVLNLDARIGLDTSDYDKGLDHAENKFTRFGSSLAGGIKNAVSSVISSVKTIAGAVGDATSKFMKDAVDAGMTFDSSMSQVAATMGKTVDEIGELRDFAQEMGSATSFSASQAADALNYMALAGYDASTSMEMLPTVLDLAAAGGIKLATASDMVTDASSALGLSIDETKIMIDQMAVASSKTNTSVAQLGDAILTIGGTAKGLKGGTQELTQVLGLMADNGIKASEAGTHLRNIMLAMNPSTDAAVGAFERLGLQSYDSEGQLRSMSDIFGDLSEKMKDMSDQERTDTLTAIFNKTDLSAVNALLDTSAERWQEVSDAIGKYDGAATKMANTQLDNLAGDITLFQSALEGAQIAVSDGLTPTLREFVQFGSDGLSKLTSAFKSGGINGAFEEFLNILGDGISKFAPMIATLAKNLVTTLFNTIKSNIGSIKGILVDIINTVAEWLTHAPELIDMAIELVSGIGGALISNIPLLLQAAIDIVSRLGTYIVENIPELVPSIIEVILGIAETLTNPDSIDTLVDVAITLMLAISEGIMNALPTILDKGYVIITRLANAIIKNVPKLANTAKEIVAMIAGTIIANLPKILNLGAQIVFKIVEGIYTWASKLYIVAAESVQQIADGFGEGIQAAKEWGKDLIDNFIGGIKQKWNDLKDAVSGVAQTVQDFLGFSEPKKGPLSNFHTYAPDMIDLFNEGLKKSEGKLKMQLTDTTSLIGENFTTDGRSAGYTAGNTVINITVTSGTISSDYDSRRAAQKISESLANLKRAQSAAIGKAV